MKRTPFKRGKSAGLKKYEQKAQIRRSTHWRTSKAAKERYRKKKSLEGKWRRWNWKQAEIFHTEFTFNEMRCECCGIPQSMSALEVDHVLPRSSMLRGDPWNPANGQILCTLCNGRKGSLHHVDGKHKVLDYRSKDRKAHLEAAAKRDWKLERWGWEKRRGR